MEPRSTSTSSSGDGDHKDWNSFFDALDFEDVDAKPVIEISAASSADVIDPPTKAREAVSNSEIAVEQNRPVRLATRINRPPIPVSVPARGSSLLEIIVDLMIKAILFQFSILVSSVTFPIWILHCSFTLLTNPLGVLKKAHNSFSSRVSRVWKKIMDRFGVQNGLGKVAIKLFWGSFWAIYVCVVLIGMFLGAFLGGGLVVSKFAEKPLEIMEELNFDYTKQSPVALVPVTSCAGASNFDLKGGGETGTRSVPANHKLSLTISLNLPESDYNRALGVFQVRAEFLSLNGEVIRSTSQPCMLKFKSTQIHLVETFIKTGPLITGYSSESQTIQVKMRGLKGGSDPVACVRLILEQRAEFKPGAGIPEIYSGSLKLESDLPVFKKMVWTMRWTIFVWFSSGIFLFELLVVLLCCRSLVLPRTGGQRDSNNWRAAR